MVVHTPQRLAAFSPAQQHQLLCLLTAAEAGCPALFRRFSRTVSLLASGFAELAQAGRLPPGLLVGVLTQLAAHGGASVPDGLVTHAAAVAQDPKREADLSDADLVALIRSLAASGHGGALGPLFRAALARPALPDGLSAHERRELLQIAVECDAHEPLAAMLSAADGSTRRASPPGSVVSSAGRRGRGRSSRYAAASSPTAESCTQSRHGHGLSSLA